MAKRSDVPLCPEWVFLNNSNVHVAKDRGWFKTYTPFASTLGHSAVLGIGTVEISTERSPDESGAASPGTLYLREVLHAPDFICNVIGFPIMSDGYNVTISPTSKSQGTITDSKGKNMAYFDPGRQFFISKLRGHPTGPQLGPHAFEEGTMYRLGCHWDSAEQQKWRDFQVKNRVTNPVSGPTSTIDETPH